MIKKFVDVWNEHKGELRIALKNKHPESYDDIFTQLVTLLNTHLGEYDELRPDPKRITVIDHGDYQGYRLFIVGATGYQPSTYFATLQGYGSCSGCDTFQGIRSYDDAPVTDQQADDYLMIALHMLEGLKCISSWEKPEEV